LDNTYFDHLHYWELGKTDQAFQFFLRDVPLAFFLVIFSLAFTVASRRYLAVYHSKIVEKCSRFLSISNGFAHTSFALAAFLFFSGGNNVWATGVALLAVLMFYLAAVYSNGAWSELRGVVKQIYEHLVDKNQPHRAARMFYIYQYGALGGLFRGWSTINMTISFYALGFTLFLFFPNSIWAYPQARYLEVTASSVFLFTTLIFVLVGAIRAQSPEGNRRYFNAVEILNKEYLLMHEPKDDEEKLLEQTLLTQSMYHLETDPTIERAPEANRTTARAYFLQLLHAFDASRLPSSMVFGLVCGMLASSATFGVSIALAMAFSFIMNDLVDFLTGKDLVGHPDRALPSGRTTVAAALLCTIGLALAFFLLNALSYETYSSPIAYFLGAVAYNLLLKEKYPVIATPFCALLFALVLSQAASFGFWEGLAVWFAVLAREFVLDYRDADADFEFNERRNIAHLLGNRVWLTVWLLTAAATTTWLVTESESAGKTNDDTQPNTAQRQAGWTSARPCRA